MGIERECCIEAPSTLVRLGMQTAAACWSVLHLHIYDVNVHALLDKDTKDLEQRKRITESIACYDWYTDDITHMFVSSLTEWG